MNYWELKELARKADGAEGEERERLVEKLIEELPKLNPYEGFDPITVLLAKEIARRKGLMRIPRQDQLS